jgi:hypothetical protein
MIATFISCSSSDKSDEEPTATTEATTAATSAAATSTAVSPVVTARPTVTPVPTATNTPTPTATPLPTATPTPTPTATPTPPAPGSAVQEIARLFSEHGIAIETLSVASVGAAQWQNESLGCPESGTYYDTTDAPYTGKVYFLSNGSQSWEYHSNHDDSVVVRCDEINRVSEPTTNLASDADLHSATELTLMRRDSNTGEFVVRRVMTETDMHRLIDIFDLETDIAPAPACDSVFRLDFVTRSGSSEVEFICAEDYSAFDIFWNGLHGYAPIVGYIIGPYLTGDPVPTLPTATP